MVPVNRKTGYSEMIVMYRFGIYSWIMAAGIVVALALAGALWRRRTPASRCIVWLELAVSVWSFGMLFEAAATTERLKFIWSVVAYPGTAASPVLFLLFAFAYRGMRHWLTPRRIALLMIIPALTVLMAATSPWHGLNWSRITIQPNNIAVYEYGWWFWVFVAYSYLMLLSGMILIAGAWWRHPPFYRGQVLLLLAGAVVPFVANIIYVFKLNPIPGLEWTPLSFLVMGAILAAGMTRWRLFDLLPLAHRTAFDTMPDAVAVFDDQQRLVDLNLAMQTVLDRPAGQLLGTNGADLPLGDPIHAALAANAPAFGHVKLPGPKGVHTYDFRVTCLSPRPGQSSGALLTLHDNTERQQLLDEHERLINELQEALAQVKTLTGLLPICAGCKKIRDDGGYWHNVEIYLQSHSDARFSHGLCPDCVDRLYPGVGLDSPDEP